MRATSGKEGRVAMNPNKTSLLRFSFNKIIIISTVFYLNNNNHNKNKILWIYSLVEKHNFETGLDNYGIHTFSTQFYNLIR